MFTKILRQHGFFFRDICAIINTNKAKGLTSMTNVFTNDLDKTLGISDEEMNDRFTKIVLLKKEEAKIKGCPVQCYDEDADEPYLLFPDGRRQYLNA